MKNNHNFIREKVTQGVANSPSPCPGSGTGFTFLIRTMSVFFFAFLLLSAVQSIAQSTDFRQLANKAPQSWINSILQQNNSTYYEGTSTLQRLVLVGVPSTTGNNHVLKLSHQASKGNIHAYDFITGFHTAQADYLEQTGTTLMNIALSGANIGPQATAAMVDALYNNDAPSANRALATPPASADYGSVNARSVASRVAAYDGNQSGGVAARSVKIYGSSAVTNASLVFMGYSGGTDKYAEYELRWTSSSSNILILLAGHLAKGSNDAMGYGSGNGSANISGGPYHFKLSTLDGASLGSQDNQIKGSDILVLPPPCTFTGPGPVCANSTNTYTGPAPADADTYAWSISTNNGSTIQGSSTSQTVSVKAGATAGSYTLTLVTTKGGVTSIGPCTLTVTVNALPPCSITGDNNVCPRSTNVYTGPAGADSYEWGITGNGTISGANNLQSVSVLAGTNCNAPYTLSLKVIKSGCESNCTASFTAVDLTDPVITGIGPNATINCPATPVFSQPTATDNCGTPTLTFQDVTTPGACAAEYSVTRTWTATDACGRTKTGSQTINVVDNQDPVINGIGPDATIICPATPVFSQPTATDNCSTPSLTFVDNTVPGSCPNTYSKTRTWTATDGCGRTKTGSQTITVIDNVKPVVTPPACNSPIQCPNTPSFGNATATDNCDPNPVITHRDVDTPGPCAGTYSRTRTWTATDACGNESLPVSCTIMVIDNVAPTLGNPGADATIACGGTPSFTPPTATDLCDPNPVVSIVSTTQTTNADGSVTHTRTWKATDACGNNSANKSQSITVAVCNTQFCTKTQGFYGNTGGSHCNGQTTTQLVTSLLSTNLVIGGNGNTLTITQAEAGCLISKLPAGGSATTIAGVNTCTSHPGILLSNGKFLNVLLGQTIALGLNLRLDATLGGWTLVNSFTTLASTGCGGTTGAPIPGTEQTFSIPQKVLNELGANKSVSNLFVLANRALSGQYTQTSSSKPSLSEINQAVDAINRGFDNCRYLVTSVVARLGQGQQEEFNPATINMTAYPNPFSGTVNFEFSSSSTEQLVLEVYNAKGERITTLFDQYVNENHTYKVQWDATELSKGIYFYRLTGPSGTRTERITFIR